MTRNKEIKSIIIKITILSIVFLAIGIYGINLYAEMINKNIVKRDFSLVGSLIEKYPTSEEDIISKITKPASEESIEEGRKVLETYGYTEDIKSDTQPLLGESRSILINFWLGLMVIFTLTLICLVYLEYRKIYGKVKTLSKVSERVMEGDFSEYLDEAEEGDFNILNHNFNQMSGRLENSLDTLKGEKIYLKDTISNISHQLKTPLSSLVVLNDILIDDPDMDKVLRLDFLEKSSSQLIRMEWLILNLLKMARIEAGAIDFKREEVYLKDVIDSAIETLKPLIGDNEIGIYGKLDSNFIGDLDWTAEAAINIIKNSLEHGRGRIWITLEESPLFASIIIRDNGRGINPEDLKNIFQRFYKAKNNIKPDSIGIGLNLSKLIVEAQEGTISVTSKKDEGTEFIIRFLKGIGSA
nr:HAMP domain-containing sensor histidine kinase [Tissierella sp.]